MSDRQPFGRRVAKAATRRLHTAVLKRRSARRAFGLLGLHVTGTGTPISMGASFPLGYAADAPIIVLVGVGVSEDVLRSSIRRLADVQVATSAFRVLVITDAATFEPARETGWALERILSEPEFDAAAGGGSWLGYVTDRVAAAVESYGASAVLPVPAHGLADASWASLLTLGSTPR